MRFISKNLGIAIVAILALSTIGCHGQYPGNTGYMPSTTAASAGQGAGGIEPSGKGTKGDIDTPCGTRIHIVIAGILNCRFREKHYKSGTFTIVNDEQGIVEITPTSGTQATKFTIVGLLVGSGHILVKDSKGNQDTLRVTVGL